MSREKRVIISLAVAAVVALVGCGEDRSTLYDDTGHKIAPSGKKVTPKVWITETDSGKQMIKNNFVYIPGGFDVDGDGIKERGFWLAKYEAKESNQTIAPSEILGNIDTLIRNNFLIYDDNSTKFIGSLPVDNPYSPIPLSRIETLHANVVAFTKEGIPASSYSPIEAVVALQHSQILDGWSISLPSEKQWMQVVKLVLNNANNWTGGEVGRGKLFQGKKYIASNQNFFVIANGILGNDENVPQDYNCTVYDLSGGLAEWTNGMIAIEDRFMGGKAGENEYTMLANIAPDWWLPMLEEGGRILNSLEGVGKYNDGSNLNGAYDTLKIVPLAPGFVDPYAVVLRGGSVSKDDDSLTGVSAAKLNYGLGFKDPSIGFRAASGYIQE